MGLWTPPNLSLLHQIKTKTISCEKLLLGGVLQKSFPKNTQNSQKNTCLESLSNTVKGLHAIRLALY